jgi:hypothetical protein
MIPISPSDLRDCPDCHQPAMVAGYWDDATQHAREILVTVETGATYQFLSRDYAGRLVIRDKDEAMKACHDWVCPAKPAPTPEPVKDEEKDRPWRGKK